MPRIFSSIKVKLLLSVFNEAPHTELIQESEGMVPTFLTEAIQHEWVTIHRTCSPLTETAQYPLSRRLGWALEPI